jgi:hypothetical protein
MPDSFTKDPDAVDLFHIIWCDIDGDNDGGSGDEGRLQGATITGSTWTVPSGISTAAAPNTNSVTIQGVTYAANTVANIMLESGTDDADYDLTNQITTSDGRTLDKTITIMVREK